MSVAAKLGVKDLNGPLMTVARVAWPGWIQDDPELGVVEDLVDLRRWMDKVTFAERDRVMAKLAALAATDVDATVTLAWLMVPRMASLAQRLADVAPDIDGLIASQLWLEIRASGPLKHSVAKTLWFNVKRGILGELGIGDAGERADKTWAATVLGTEVDAVAPAIDDDGQPEARHVLRVVVEHLIEMGEMTPREAHLLLLAAGNANWLGKPMRGRAGLTAPESLEVLTHFEPTKSRTMRRDVVRILDRIAVLAADLDMAMLLAKYPDDGLSFHEWALGVGRPKHARVMRNYREVELSLIGAHVATWDPETERCGSPDTCPECIRASSAA